MFGCRGNDPVEMIQGVAKGGSSGRSEVLGLQERMGFRTPGTGLGFSKKAGRLCRCTDAGRQLGYHSGRGGCSHCKNTSRNIL